METETIVEIHQPIEELLALGAKNLKIVLIHHDKAADPHNTSLVIRGELPTGRFVDKVACPNPCQIGKAFQ
jgi:hypothetical protein